MNRLRCDGLPIWTGSAIAAAVLAYAAHLTSTGESSTIDVPVREIDGTTVVRRVPIGPSSVFVSVDLGVGAAEIIDQVLVCELLIAAGEACCVAPFAIRHGSSSAG